MYITYIYVYFIYTYNIYYIHIIYIYIYIYVYIKYHFLSFWYDSTQVSWAISEHSNHYANVWYCNKILCNFFTLVSIWS